ncbi:MAG: sucrase ferredoxin [Cyanobacteria bacterium J06614_10]
MLKDCQFCSVISKNNGEDPIGTASTHDYWLFIDLPLPWIFENWRRDPVMGQLIALFEWLILKKGVKLRPLAIAPDADYSQPGYHRILFYHRPSRLFSRYQKREYLVPTERLRNAVNALLQFPERLVEFEIYQQHVHTRDLFICTHGNVDVACARFGNPIYNALRADYTSPTLRVWRCSHFGGHRFAPTLIDLPVGQFFGHIGFEQLDPLIHRQGDWQQLRNCYRGWAGVDPMAQIAEREIWMRLGWPWLDYAKATLGAANLAPVPTAAAAITTVQIEFQDIQGEKGTYDVEIESIEAVETASKSGVDMKLEKVKQYRAVKVTFAQ